MFDLLFLSVVVYRLYKPPYNRQKSRIVKHLWTGLEFACLIRLMPVYFLEIYFACFSASRPRVSDNTSKIEVYF